MPDDFPFVAIANNDWKKMLELMQNDPLWASLNCRMQGFQYALAKRVLELLKEGNLEEIEAICKRVSDKAPDLEDFPWDSPI